VVVVETVNVDAARGTDDDGERFLTALASRGFEPLLAKVSGTLAIHLVDGPDTTRWFLGVDKGHVTVERGTREADSTLTLVRGQANATAAVLRGEVQIDGSLEVLMALQRIFPGPGGGGWRP
jgi:hypothetical protein